MGVNVSKIKSLTLDDWEEKDLQMMLAGGNLRLKEYFKSVGMYEEERDLTWKWRTRGAVYYR